MAQHPPLKLNRLGAGSGQDAASAHTHHRQPARRHCLLGLQLRNPAPFFTLVTGPRRSLSLKLSDTRVYEPQIRARLGTTAHFCKVVVLKLRAVPV